MVIEDQNEVVLGGIVGDRIDLEPVPHFALKTVRTMKGEDGDQLEKFDWHRIVCRDKDFVKNIRAGMRVRVRGIISTTVARGMPSSIARSSIIALSIELESDELWGTIPKRRRSA